MVNLTSTFNYELPNIALHINTYAQKILESGGSAAATAATALRNTTTTTTTTSLNTNIFNRTDDDNDLVITTLSSDIVSATATPLIAISSNQVSNLQVAAATTSELFQRFSAQFFKQLQSHAQSQSPALTTFNSSAAFGNNSHMDMDYPTNQIIIDSSSFDAMDELHKQMAYDKLMNDVWIGVVLTLVLISLVFCMCSCFLYHQFRTWKRNYHSTVLQAANAANSDLEAATKLHGDLEDPVPEYTLVSGLPTYEAALELLQQTQAPTKSSCLFVYPSVFNVFALNEKDTATTMTPVHGATLVTATAAAATASAAASAHKVQHATSPTSTATMATPSVPCVTVATAKATALTTAALMTVSPTTPTHQPTTTTLQQSQSITEVTTPLLSRAAVAMATATATKTTATSGRRASLVARQGSGNGATIAALPNVPTMECTSSGGRSGFGDSDGVGGVKCFMPITTTATTATKKTMLPTYGNVCGSGNGGSGTKGLMSSAYDITNGHSNNRSSNSYGNNKNNAITIVIPDIATAATSAAANDTNNNSGHVNGHGIDNGKSTVAATTQQQTATAATTAAARASTLSSPPPAPQTTTSNSSLLDGRTSAKC